MPPEGIAEVDLCGEKLLLDPDRAVIWPARRTLIVADPHFAKDDIFRRSGIALPRGPAIHDLQRLSKLIRAHSCARLLILGDFVHGATREGDGFLHAFAAWRTAHSTVTVEIVAGNHDRRESAFVWKGVARWHTQPVVEGPFVFTHHPAPHPEGYVLAGHIHPVLQLRRKGGGGRVPVFWQRAEALVLPSFGSFTGGAEIQTEAGDRLYIAGPERVVALAPKAPA